MRHAIIALALLALPAAGFAEEGPAPARIRHVEGDVTLQRATEAAAEPAVPNLIWLGGDRLWTDAGARAELQLPDGSLIHLATASKLDLIGYDDEAAAARLWAGSLSLWVPATPQRPDVVVETPDAAVSVREPGLYRIDAIAGETRLSVLRGAASLESGGERLALREGERSWARYGEPPDRPEYFDAQTGDAFDTWVDARLRQSRHGLPAGVPAEIEPWGGELSEYGDWSVVPEVGTVWRPRVVATGWQPYQVGHWAWSPWGWSWVSAEPWGWAPYHYGRWDFSVSLGWYWSPGRVWGPAWVSWSIGSGYVGWCPLGLRGGPVFPHHRLGHGSRGWLYVEHRGLGARHLGRHRVSHARLRAARFTHLGSGHQPGRRGIRAVERRAVPRTHRSAFGDLERRAGPAARPGTARRGDRDRWRPAARPGPEALSHDGLRDRRTERRGLAARPRTPARDHSRPAASSRSDRSRSGVAPRSRPAARSRSTAPERTRSFTTPRRSRPAARSAAPSRDPSRPAASSRSDRSRSGVAPRSRPAARSRSTAPERTRSFATPRRSRPAARSAAPSRDPSRPAARSRSDRSRPGVAPRSRPSARSRSRPSPSTRSAAPGRTSRPSAHSRGASRESSRPAARSRDGAARRSAAPRGGGRSRSPERKRRQR